MEQTRQRVAALELAERRIGPNPKLVRINKECRAARRRLRRGQPKAILNTVREQAEGQTLRCLYAVCKQSEASSHVWAQVKEAHTVLESFASWASKVESALVLCVRASSAPWEQLSRGCVGASLVRYRIYGSHDHR